MSINQMDWRASGVPVSVIMASSGWSDLSSLKLKKGLSKMALATAIASGTNAAVMGRDVGDIKLKEIAVTGIAVAGAGLVFSIFSNLFVRALKAEAREYCQNLKEDFLSLFQRKENSVRSGQASSYI